MILVIDNFDSFTYNLVQYLGEVTNCDAPILVRRNDAVGVADIRKLKPTHIVISPGPCTPNESGISLDIIRELPGQVPILGVCLGHQAIAQVFGGNVVRAEEPVHGKTSAIFHNGQGIFSGIEDGFAATRYHSLIVEPSTLPACLEVTAKTAGGEIMGLVHREFRTLIGLQFHPESIMTKAGKKLLDNFISCPAAASKR